MSRMQLMLDSASYNKELRQARQALQAHKPSRPLPPGRLVGARPPSQQFEMGGPLLDHRPVPVVPEMGSSYLDTQPVPTLSQSSSSSSSDLIENHSPSFRESLSSRASIPSARAGPCLDNSFVPAVPQVPSGSSSDLRDDRSSSFRESLSSRAAIPSARNTEPFPGFGFKRDLPTPFYETSSPHASVPPARTSSFLDTEAAPVSSPWQPQPWGSSQPSPPERSQSPSSSEPFRPPRFAPAVIALLETLHPLSSQVPNAQMLRLVNQVGRAFFNER